MKIINKTHWQTRQLKAIIVRVANTELKGYEKRKKRLIIEITYSRKGGHHGCAYVGGTHAYLRIPKAEVDKPQFAWLVAHELSHIRGQHHKTMTKPQLYWSLYFDQRMDATSTRCTSDINEPLYSWAKDLPLEVKLTRDKIKPTVNQDMLKIEAAEKRWNTKLKRAQTALKKLANKRKYLQRKGLKLAASHEQRKTA